MPDLDKQYLSRTHVDATQIDVGLRAHMLRVYNYMAMALALTGVIAFGASEMAVVTDSAGRIVELTGFGALVYGSPLRWVVMLAPLALVFLLAARIQKMSFSAAQTTFWVYAGLVGLSLATVFMVYTGESIARVFFITAGAFAGLSLYGYTTKRDLSGMGGFLMMGLIGGILLLIVNLFLGSSSLQWLVSAVLLLVFIGLTAYDTQQIKEMYYAGDGHEVAGKKAIMGALRLYLDFINLFMMLLHLFGNRE